MLNNGLKVSRGMCRRFYAIENVAGWGGGRRCLANGAMLMVKGHPSHPSHHPIQRRRRAKISGATLARGAAPGMRAATGEGAALD